MRVEWDTEKEQANITKHGVDFTEATAAFYDQQKLIEIDAAHSGEEPRLLCIGRTGRGILTVRFTYRGEPFGSSAPVIGGKAGFGLGQNAAEPHASGASPCVVAVGNLPACAKARLMIYGCARRACNTHSFVPHSVSAGETPALPSLTVVD